ncbi:MAG: DNA-3-methyladenine glycosylase I [Alphaproteobacteria bacterium]
MSEPKRCGWVGDDPLYQDYHDTEWGVAERDDRALFEKLILDGFQAGLSWITILKKRENFRVAFDGFRPDIIAGYGEDKIVSLLQDAGIIRHRGKIEATIGNARSYLRLMERDGGFAGFLWQFTDGEVLKNNWRNLSQVPAKTKESEAMSKALKAEGFKFCGPTICYAFMQAVGMVNDHTTNCFRYESLT